MDHDWTILHVIRIGEVSVNDLSVMSEHERHRCVPLECFLQKIMLVEQLLINQLLVRLCTGSHQVTDLMRSRSSCEV